MKSNLTEDEQFDLEGERDKAYEDPNSECETADEWIEALTIFKKYDIGRLDIAAFGQDIVVKPPTEMLKEDEERLCLLGFVYKENIGCFSRFTS